MNISCRDDEGQSSGLMFIRHSHCLCEYILDPVLHLRPVFSTAFLSDMRDFERAGNPVLLNRLLLRRHDIDRTQHATRQEIYAHSPRLRRHLRLSRHRHHNRHHRKTRVSVSLLSVLRAPERTRPSLQISDESGRLWAQVWVYLSCIRKQRTPIDDF